jgi:hypothetical protein
MSIKTYNRFPHTGRSNSGAGKPRTDAAEFLWEAARYPSLHTNLVQAIKFGQTNIDGLGDHVFKDWSGNGNHAIAHGTRYFGDFDGTDDSAELAIHADFQPGASDFSIVAWVMMETVVGNNYAVSNYNSATGQRSWLFYYQAGELALVTSSTGVNTQGHLSTNSNIANLLNTWVNIVCVKEDETVTFYENGVALTDNAGGAFATLHNSTANLVIGDSANSVSPFAGGVQDVKFYKGKALTAAEVLTGYQTNVWPTGATLKGDWPINEASGDFLDASGNSHDLTPSGVTRRQGGLTHSPTIVTGVGMGGAMDLEGTSSHTRTPDYDPRGGGASKNELTVFVASNDSTLGGILCAQFDTTANQRMFQMYFTFDTGIKLRCLISDDGTGAAGNIKDYRGSQIISGNGLVTTMLRISSGITMELGVNGVPDGSETKLTDAAITALHNSTMPVMAGGQLADGVITLPNGTPITEVYIYNAVKTDQDFLDFHNKHATF